MASVLAAAAEAGTAAAAGVAGAAATAKPHRTAPNSSIPGSCRGSCFQGYDACRTGLAVAFGIAMAVVFGSLDEALRPDVRKHELP
jgi:hypothetical protein